MRLRISAIAGVLLVLLIAGSGVSAASQNHVDDEINHVDVNQCTTITEPGNYVVNSDLSPENRDFCIIIEDTKDIVLNVKNHTISGNLMAAVYVIDSHNITIRNTITNNTKKAGLHGVSGIQVVSSNRVRLEGNTIKNNTHEPAAWRGLLFEKSENLYVRENRVEGGGFRRESGVGSGIQFRNSRNITVANNTIFGTPTAIAITNSRNTTVKGNHLERNVYGIQMRKYSSDILVQANTIINHSLCPMDVKNSSDIAIDGNYLERHGGLGLEINATNVTITNNFLKDSTDFGIEVITGSSSVVITNNTVINSSKKAGIAVFGRVSDVVIEHNTISNNTPHGILLKHNAIRITIRYNSIRENTNSGVMILPSVEEVTIADNQIVGNSGPDINNSVSHGVTIENNDLSEGKETGGDTEGAHVTQTSSATVEQSVDKTPDESRTSPATGATEAPGQPGFGHTIALVALVLFLSLTSRFARSE